jgi:hypothetical protein
MCAPEKELLPWHFVPDFGNESKPVDLTQMTPEEQAAYVLNQFTGKSVIRKKK